MKRVFPLASAALSLVLLASPALAAPHQSADWSVLAPYANEATNGTPGIADDDELSLAQADGLDTLPGNARAVCAARAVSLKTSGWQAQIQSAIDRASVCKLRAVTIQAPRRQAARVSQEIAARGVDSRLIQIQPADGQTVVRINFSGIATSRSGF